MARTREIRAQNEQVDRGVDALHQAGVYAKEAVRLGVTRRGAGRYLALALGAVLTEGPTTESTPDRQVRGA